MSSNPAMPSNDRLLAALEAQAGDDPVRLRTLALMQAAADRHDAALASFERAVVLKPDYADAWISLARLLIDLKRHGEAVAAAREAAKLAPQDKLAWHLLGMGLHELDLLDQAADAQRRAVALDPEFRDGWRWLGYSLETDGDLIGAEQAYERTLALRYEAKTALHLAMLGPTYATDMAQLDWARERLPRALQALADSGFKEAVPHRLFDHVTGLYAYWGDDDLPLHRAFAAFCRRIAPNLIWRAPHVDAWKPPVGRRPRVAWITYFVYPHTVERMWNGIPCALPEFGFDVKVFTNFTGETPERARLEKATGTVTVLPETIEQARQMVAEFEPDIVIYPELGMNTFNYCLGFARLAPLQISSWGHAATSGLDEIDVFLGSSDLDPPCAERFYSEELVRLDPPPICYQPHLPGETDSDLAALKLPPEAKIYLCIQSLLKLRPDFDAVLAKILAADANGIVVIVGRRALQSLRIFERRFAAAIPDWRRRVRMVPWLANEDFTALLRRADAILDTHHFAGGHTSYDMIALGLPFVTLPGLYSKGRVGTMLYRAIGVEELIARDEDHYVELAVRLANDRPWRAALAARIAAGAPKLVDWRPGLKVLAEWLHARIAQMGRTQ